MGKRKSAKKGRISDVELERAREKELARRKKAKSPGKRRKKTVSRVKDDSGHQRDFSYTQNREVSWLGFDNRVLDEAFDEAVPLFERLKFAAIFGSNLDEWFMIRIGGLSDLALLKRQPTDNKSGKTPSEQLVDVFDLLPGLIERQGRAVTQIERSLASHGLTRVRPGELTDADLTTIKRHFDARVAPIISPLIVDPRHPFPNLRNGQLYVACSLDGPDELGVLGIVEVPPTLPRVVELPSKGDAFRYVLLEDEIISRLDSCFGGYRATSSAVIRVTRNADLDPDGDGVGEVGEDADYRQHMKKVLKRRQRLQPVRLEVEGALGRTLEDYIVSELGLGSRRVFHVRIPLDLGYVYSLEGHIADDERASLLWEPFEPQASPMVADRRPMREQVEDHDVLLFYPYESMSPLLRLLREASTDDACISIKVTLYRVAKQSRLCESLINAAENGKEVTVLMELRARFDEANNIAWADQLEEAGCTVIYGSEGFKCHSKICQITYHDGDGLRRITCLGTGNFNEKTARLYSDFMLLTAHPGIGEDGSTFFRNLSLGNLRGSYEHLAVAPTGLKPLVMRGLDHEIEKARAGEPAQVFMKMNSLTDRDVIDKVAEACQAGVRMVMIIRGIVCMRANVANKTDGLIVRQIVGRYLEHARVYAFGADSATVYLSSADMMTRNTERRVEIAFPVLDATCRNLVVQYVNLQLADNAKARQLTAKGTWEPLPMKTGARIDSQALLMEYAYQRSHAIPDTSAASMMPDTRIVPNLSVEEIRALTALPTISMPGEDEQAPARGDDADAAPRGRAVPPQADGASQAGRTLAPDGTPVTPTADRQEGGRPTPPADTDAGTSNECEIDASEQAGPGACAACGDAPEDEGMAEGPGGRDTGDGAPGEVARPLPDARTTPLPTVIPTLPKPTSDGKGAEGTDARPAASPTSQDGSGRDEVTTLVLRQPGRFSLGFRLIWLGIKALLTGRINTGGTKGKKG